MQECCLCFEEETIFGVGFCNHGPICYKCNIKCRNKLETIKCPICKVPLQKLGRPEGNHHVSRFLNLLIFFDKKSKDLRGILYSDPQIKDELDQLNFMTCWVKNCREEKQFNTIGFLKRHLKEKHNKILCDVCVENKTALLKEQILYSQNGLDKHLKNGDYDEDGNLIFFHPYCQFCNKYFYNEEQFSKHMSREHFSCTVCAEQQKFMFYKDYKSLETHFKISHYLCMYQECLDRTYQVFGTAAEKQLHDAQFHGGQCDDLKKGKQGLKLNMNQMSGFHYEPNPRFQSSNQQQKFVIKDNEGIDVESQYQSQRKIQSKQIKLIEKWDNPKLDVRSFYGPLQENLEDEEDYFKRVWAYDNKNKQKQQDSDIQLYKKEKYVKESYKKAATVKEEVKVQEIVKDEPIFFEEQRLVKFTKLQMMNIDKFDIKLRNLLSSSQKFEDYQSARTDYFENKISAHEFFLEFKQIMGNKKAFQIFPYFITCIPNKETSQELDNAYYQELLKLPMKNKSIIINCSTYLDLLLKLQELIDRQLIKNIETNQTPVLQPLETAKYQQLFEILRRVSTPQYCAFKYGANFGINLETIHLIKEKVFCGDSNLDSLSVEDINNLSLYVDWAIINIQNQEIKQQEYENNRLTGFLQRNQEIKNKYLKRIQEEEEQREKIQVKLFAKSNSLNQGKQTASVLQENANKTIQSQSQNIQVEQAKKTPEAPKKPQKAITSDKYEFPGLDPNQNITNQLISQVQIQIRGKSLKEEEMGLLITIGYKKEIKIHFQITIEELQRRIKSFNKTFQILEKWDGLIITYNQKYIFNKSNQQKNQDSDEDDYEIGKKKGKKGKKQKNVMTAGFF